MAKKRNEIRVMDMDDDLFQDISKSASENMRSKSKEVIFRLKTLKTITSLKTINRKDNGRKI
jgi:hypothetical protein